MPCKQVDHRKTSCIALVIAKYFLKQILLQAENQNTPIHVHGLGSRRDRRLERDSGWVASWSLVLP